MLKNTILIISIFFLVIPFAFSQPKNADKKYWELKQEDLEKLIQESDLIVSGTIVENKYIKVEEVILGSQQHIKKVILSDIKGKTFDSELSYICFLKRKETAFIAFSEYSFIKNDIFLMTRVRKEATKMRISESHYVVVASVNSVKEISTEEKIEVAAECQVMENLKGKLPEKFLVNYIRIPNSQPPTIFLFENLSYIFFIKRFNDTFQLLNSYDAAIGLRSQTLKEIKAITSVGSRFDEVAGQAVNGIQLVIQTEEKIALQKPVMLNIVLQNIIDKDIEIYHNSEQVHYFLLFHIIDAQGNLIAIEYPRKNSVPDLDKAHFLKLPGNDYCLFPPLNLQQYCKLSLGKYRIYVEYDLPWKYSGSSIGKSAWYGKVVSNCIDLDVVEQQ